MSFLYNTGARVQEACDIHVGDVHLEQPFSACITGKGRKTRIVPLWAETAELLKDYTYERRIIDESSARVFVNARGEPLTRFGINYIFKTRTAKASQYCPSLSGRNISPHVIRHTTAMHLLQSGVDLFVIQSWLGHVNLSTTHGYVEIDLEMKHKALSACAPMDGTDDQLRTLINKNKDVISWLESLGKRPPLC